jgi:hypothetical protein
MVSGVVIGIAMGRVIMPSLPFLVLSACTGAAIAYVTRSSVAVLLMPLSGIAATVLVLYVLGSVQLLPGSLSPWLLLGAVAIFTTLCSWLFRRIVQSDEDFATTALVSCIGFAWLFYSSRIPWDGASSLAQISTMEEDNGSWLQGTAELLQSSGVIRASSGLPLGGWTGSVFGVVAVTAARLFATLENNALDSAIVTMRMYWILAAAISFMGALMTHTAIRRSRRQAAVVPGLVAGFIMVPFALSLFSYGHFTALLATLFAVASLLLLQLTAIGARADLSNRFLVPGSLLLLFAMGSAWYVSFGLLLTAIGAIGTQSLFTQYKQRKSTFGRVSSARASQVLPFALLVAVLAFLGWKVLQPLVSRLGDPSYVSYLLSLGGGAAEVEPILATAIIFFALLFSGTSASSRLRRNRMDVIVVCLIALSVVGMFTASFLIPPFGPNYGATKWLGIASFVLTPLAIAGISRSLEWRTGMRRPIAQVTLVVVCLSPFVMRWEPYFYVYQLLKPVSPAWWQPAATIELRENPDRTIVCLDTRRDNWSGSSLICTRMLAGLQGRWSDITAVWYAGNVCNVNSNALAVFDNAVWQNLTIIVTDGSRLTSTNSCDNLGWSGQQTETDPQFRLGWLTYVEWKDVRVVDPNGIPVNKSFDYLRNESQYTEEVIDSLNASL